MASLHHGGVLIAGASRQCGKTVVTTGIAAALGQSGVRVQAYTPLVFAKPTSLTARHEQLFINTVTGQYMASESLLADSAETVTVPEWNRLMETCGTFPYPVLLDCPGQIATPWAFIKNQLQDVANVAKSLDMPVLLVAKGDQTFLESTRLALTFLMAQGARPIGFIRVATQPEDRPEAWSALMVSQQFQLPFLGDLPYSPSVSVLAGQQGNLIRLTEESIDLLPLQYAMGVHLS